MGAETCERCGRAVLQQLCVGKADGECGAWVSTMPEWRAECLLVAYTRQRARADAAEAAWAKAKFRALPEIAQDALDAVLARAHGAESTIHECEMRRDAAETRDREAEATIATLREEVERKDKALRAAHAELEKHDKCPLANDASYETRIAIVAALSPPQASTTTQGGEG